MSIVAWGAEKVAYWLRRLAFAVQALALSLNNWVDDAKNSVLLPEEQPTGRVHYAVGSWNEADINAPTGKIVRDELGVWLVPQDSSELLAASVFQQTVLGMSRTRQLTLPQGSVGEVAEYAMGYKLAGVGL